MCAIEDLLDGYIRSWKIIVGEIGGQFLESLNLSHQIMLEMDVLVLAASVQSSPVSYCSDVLARMRILLKSIKISGISYGQSSAENLLVDCEIMAEFSLGLGYALTKVPLRRSSSACWISAGVFITKGP